MEISTLVIGIIIGFIIGGILSFVAFKSMQSTSDRKVTHTESELKALLAIQARQHLDISRQALTDIQNKTAELASHLNIYESSLTEATSVSDDGNDAFFGEHTSAFLRNSLKVNKQDIALATPDTQPRDFANSGSGVFVGALTEQSEKKKTQGQ